MIFYELSRIASRATYLAHKLFMLVHDVLLHVSIFWQETMLKNVERQSELTVIGCDEQPLQATSVLYNPMGSKALKKLC